MRNEFYITSLLLCCLGTTALSAPTSSDDVAGIMKKVFDWQIANPKRSPASWYNGTFYTGVSAAYQATEDSAYLDALNAVSKKNGWKLGRRPRHADDHCIGQAYLDLYLLDPNSAEIDKVQSTFDALVVDPAPEEGKEMLWWWCDSLFMDPPALVRLTAATGDPKYTEFMNTLWWDTTDLLYDTDEYLFFRDKRFLNGKRKIFWSRGNGWVMAGLCRVLPFIPEDHPDRNRYVTLFKEMSAKLATLQQSDGFWRSNLIEPSRFSEKESSGTGFFTYALAWGINQGLLPKEEVLPVVQKGWAALCSVVNEEGKVEWVQAMGARPNHTKQESTEPYAAGAFLLAGSEVLKLENSYSWSAEPLTTITNLAIPECVVSDTDGTIYISNVGDTPGAYWNDDGNGTISVPGTDKRLEGLNSPKGMCLLDGHLYFNDNTRLMRTALPLSAKTEMVADGFIKANDLATDGESVWLSDMVAGKIYCVSPDGTKRDIPAPAGVNGLTFDGDKLFAVSWALHEVYELDPKGIKEPIAFGVAEHFTNLDAVEVLSDGTFLISDLKGNKISTVGADRSTVTTLIEIASPADIGLNREKMLLYVPQFTENKVAVFQLKRTE